MVAMNFTPTNEPTSPRKHSGKSLDPIPEHNDGTGLVNSLHGNQSNGVPNHMNGTSSGAFSGTTTPQTTDNSLVNHTVANHTSAQGNISRHN